MRLTFYEAETVNIDNRSIQVSAFHGDPVTTYELSDQIASRFGGTPRVELNLAAADRVCIRNFYHSYCRIVKKIL